MAKGRRHGARGVGTGVCASLVPPASGDVQRPVTGTMYHNACPPAKGLFSRDVKGLVLKEKYEFSDAAVRHFRLCDRRQLQRSIEDLVLLDLVRHTSNSGQLNCMV
jgi:hypothetical protein